MKRSLFFIAALHLVSFNLAHADCEQLLQREFTRTPDDYQNGLVTNQVPITPGALLAAYQRGIFPWASGTGGRVRWHRPPLRGVLDFSDVHISRSDWKFIRQARASGEFQVTFDEAFEEVIRHCATVPRFITNPYNGLKVQDGAWITPRFIEAYTELHHAGLAHSVEVWRNGKLVGGLYGIFMNGIFVGESMFHLEPNVTKLAMLALIERLASKGHQFMDTQMAIGLARKWGAKLIPRLEYERRLAVARQLDRTY